MTVAELIAAMQKLPQDEDAAYGVVIFFAEQEKEQKKELRRLRSREKASARRLQRTLNEIAMNDHSDDGLLSSGHRIIRHAGRTWNGNYIWCPTTGKSEQWMMLPDTDDRCCYCGEFYGSFTTPNPNAPEPTAIAASMVPTDHVDHDKQ